MRRLHVSAIACLGLLAAGGCAESVAGTPAGPTPDLATLKVTSVQRLPGVLAVRLSPDGKWLLGGRDVCVNEVDGPAWRCVERERVDGDTPSARWSPDGTRLVLTENYHECCDEPDVWVFDVDSGKLRDLTDDGVDGPDGFGDLSPDARSDILPSWSPDGDSIWFARGGQGATQLMSVPATGGEPAALGRIDCALTDLTALAWSADRVAWTCGVEYPAVWLADHDGGGATRVLTGSDWEEKDWEALSFAPDGLWLLADSVHQYEGYAGSPGGGLARAVPSAGGDPIAVAGGKVSGPTWAPGGHAIAYVDPPGSIRVVAEPGGEPIELYSARKITVADAIRLSWVPGRLIVAVGGKPTLLTLT